MCIYSQLLPRSSWWQSICTQSRVWLCSGYQNPNREAASTPTFLRFTNIDMRLLPRRLCTLSSHYWCRNIKSSGFIPLSPLTALMDEGNQVRCLSGTEEETCFCTRCTSSRLPDSVIYWTGASCHCWVIAAETVTHSGCGKPAGFTLGSCFTAAACWRCSPQLCGLPVLL